MGASGNWSLLSHLKRAIQKITRQIASTLGRYRGCSNNSGGSRRPRSSRSFQMGLYRSVAGGGTLTPRNQLLSWGARGCSEEGDDEEDIDSRAEDFIVRFRRQLLMERQASLALRYRRGDSF